MDRRAALVPSLPRSNPTLSYWQDPPHPLANHRTTQNLPVSTSVVVIGSGITGASVAYNILEKHAGTDVLMLEARTVCSGATGRNGGHTKSCSWRSWANNAQCRGIDQAAQIARFEYDGIKAIHAFARRHAIECDSWEGETADIIYDKSQWLRAKKAISEMKQVFGEDDPVVQYKFHDASETAEKYLAHGALGSVSYEAGSINAYRFVMGLIKLALDQGLHLQTWTPALSISQSGSNGLAWEVETSRGCIRAEKVIMATNGYTAYLYPPLRGIIVPLRGTVAAQRPGSGLPKEGLQTTYSFIYGNGYEYMIFRPVGSRYAGDLVIGGCSTKAPEEGLHEWGTTDDTTMDPNIAQFVRDSAAEYFGSHWGEDHGAGKIRQQWTGIMGYSSQGFPLVGKIPNEENLWIAASFQGSGMVLCFRTAQALVTMLYGEENEEFNDWFPEAFRMSEERLKHKFRGRLHEKAPVDLELQSQL
ncbi:MAG: hypothetical protein Q9202_005767 [Teloschistes flavicans]